MNHSAWRHPITAVAVAGLTVALVSGCTRNIDDATPRPAALAAPITEIQVVDLLSPKVLGEDGNLFVTAEPESCSGLAREVDPPFIDAHRPLATDGGHWTTDDASVFVEEMAAVYRFEFDPVAALNDARKTIESCRGTALTVTTMQERTYVFDVPPMTDHSPQGSVLWTLRRPSGIATTRSSPPTTRRSRSPPAVLQVGSTSGRWPRMRWIESRRWPTPRRS